VVTNIDGMEWRRDKFGRWARLLLRALEWFAILFSHKIVADNEGIVAFARQIYKIEPLLIAYGGDHSLATAEDFGSFGENYAFSVARIEPENNCHIILEACAASDTRLIFVGNWEASAYGRSLRSKFGLVPKLTLHDPVYDIAKLAHLRKHAGFYLHGHSIGGTNPSLVEAIFHHDRIIAFDCIFNRATLTNSGAYFRDAEALEALMADTASGEIATVKLEQLRKEYVWSSICVQYLEAFGCSP
jgi:glycosyltransferase involved in cell wall biosynthesis